MSLLDVLRYPISSPPTKDELAALPQVLYNNWIASSEWGKYSNHTVGPGNYITGTSHVSEWYTALYPRTGARDNEDLARLKQMIKDWDTDELI